MILIKVLLCIFNAAVPLVEDSAQISSMQRRWLLLLMLEEVILLETLSLVLLGVIRESMYLISYQVAYFLIILPTFYFRISPRNLLTAYLCLFQVIEPFVLYKLQQELVKAVFLIPAAVKTLKFHTFPECPF